MAFRAGIIGLGFIGGADQVSGDALGQEVTDLDGTHLFALQNHADVELVAGSSRDEGRRSRFAGRTGARTYADWQEMIRTEELDIVSIATYAPQHAEMTLGCVTQGVRAIFCEKPITTTLADAQEMVDRSRQAGVLLAINHNRRFNPAFRQLRDRIQAGELGELTSINLQWGSGRLGNVGTHIFNAACMLASRRVEAASAMLDLSARPDCRGSAFQDPGGWGMLRMEGGLIATFDAADFASVPFSILVNGREGRAVVSENTIAMERAGQPADTWPILVEGTSSMDRAVEEIVEWLKEGGDFADPADNSLHTLEVIVACHASHKANAAWKTIPLDGEDRLLEIRSG
ncbi:MAG: Gfo/Idh/MocA family oxidoreductase [Pirellulaceae bacterium]|nr:Gfo/Idh/MocA family oxidoreductase [Pirellulaceae bacterium]